MFRCFGALACAAFLLAGCASNPQQTSLKLSTTDTKYSSADCRMVRGQVLTYDDKVPERALTGMALGLFLGPFGIPVAVAVDAEQNKKREMLNKELTRSCVTGGEKIVAEQEAKEAQALAEEQERKAVDIH